MENEGNNQNSMLRSFVNVCQYSNIRVNQIPSMSTTTTSPTISPTTTSSIPSMVVGLARNVTQILSFPSSTIKVLYNPGHPRGEMMMKNMKNKEGSEDWVHYEGWEMKPLYSLARAHSSTTLYDSVNDDDSQ